MSETMKTKTLDFHEPTVPARVKRSLLQPVAYDESVMPALRLARSSRRAHGIAKFLLLLLLITVGLMMFAPWQQSVKGTGNVIAFSPNERPQSLEATIKGRIVRLGENIFENAQVVKGQFIAEIQDLDPNYAARLEEQVTMSEEVINAMTKVWLANQENLNNALEIERLFELQIERYRTIKEDTISSANAMVDMAKGKVEAAQQEYQEAVAAKEQIDQEFARDKLLYQDGIYNDEKFQQSQRKMKEATIKVDKMKAYIDVANEELKSKEKDRDIKISKADIDIDYAVGMVQKAQSDVAKANSEVSKAQSELNKAQKDLTESRIKSSRQQSQQIVAPFDGTIVKITPNQGSQIIKEGDPICMIVPETKNRSVEIYLSGNDAPLIETGRDVRLQFEGWPALQFSGWPQVAVGTFGGKVISVDATDNGYGKFRVLVGPMGVGQEWPEPRFLKQGVRVNGWVLLDQVPLWYEVWRNLNGFPPAIDLEKTGGEKDEKAPKPPKIKL